MSADIRAVSFGDLRGVAIDGTGTRRPAPVLLLHGAWGGHGQFLEPMRSLASMGFDCYAVSLRGRDGVPPAHAGGVTFADYLADALQIVEALPSQPAVLGHSLGAMLALKIAELGRCGAAVLVSAPPPAGIRQPPTREAFRATVAMLPAIARGRPTLPSARVMSPVLFGSLPQDQQAACYRSLVPESGRVLRELAIGIKIEPSRVSCPVLCVVGDDDRVNPPRIARAIASRFGTDIKEFPGRGHWLLSEPGHEEVVAEIGAWLSSRT